jgi:cytochrome c oxidase subunit IV
MSDEASTSAGTATETGAPDTETTAPAEEQQDQAQRDQPGTALEPAEAAPPARPEPQVPMLPGEVRPHPTPQKYVMIAAILVVATAAEVGLYYLEGEVPDGLIITLLLMFAVVKFALVASWYMHLRTDKPIFRRFFVLGIVAAIALYLVVLTTLHVFGG